MQAIKVKIPGKIIKIPYLTFRGQTEGKTCVISGGVHGDEVNGIQLVREFIEYARKHKIEKTLKGKIIILPIVNQKGFEKNSRFNPEDDKDINRNYNKKEKTASNLIANALERHFYSKADLAIDCHDSGIRNILLPHTRVHEYENDYCTKCSKNLAKAFGSKIIVERKGKKGMLAIEMAKKYSLPVITVEVGGALKIADKYINQSLEGILNILRKQGFLSGEIIVPKKQYYLKNRFGVPAKESGILKFYKKLGQRVHADDKIGEIYIPRKAKTSPLTSPMCGLIFSIQHADSATKGEIIYSILEDKKCHIKRRSTTGMFEEIKNISM